VTSTIPDHRSIPQMAKDALQYDSSHFLRLLSQLAPK
jgi:hypothetical protein